AVVEPEDLRRIALDALDILSRGEIGPRTPSAPWTARPIPPGEQAAADAEATTDPDQLPDIPAWESITRSRRPDRPGVRGLLRVAARTVVPLNGTGQGEHDPGI